MKQVAAYLLRCAEESLHLFLPNTRVEQRLDELCLVDAHIVLVLALNPSSDLPRRLLLRHLVHCKLTCELAPEGHHWGHKSIDNQSNEYDEETKNVSYLHVFMVGHKVKGENNIRERNDDRGGHEENVGRAELQHDDDEDVIDYIEGDEGPSVERSHCTVISGMIARGGQNTIIPRHAFDASDDVGDDLAVGHAADGGSGEREGDSDQ